MFSMLEMARDDSEVGGGKLECTAPAATYIGTVEWCKLRGKLFVWLRATRWIVLHKSSQVKYLISVLID